MSHEPGDRRGDQTHGGADGPLDPIAVADPDRLRALRATGLLDSAPEEAFDRVTRIAAKLLRGSTALISLVDDRRQFFKSAVGLGEPWATLRETPLSHSFCKHVVGTGRPLVVPDARRDPELRDNGAVRDLGVVAYLGVPLASADGHVLGSLCVIDPRPHAWSEDEVDVLRDLAATVITEIELRRAHRESEARAAEAEAAHEALALTNAVVASEVAERRRSEEQFRLTIDHAPIGMALVGLDGRFVRVNHALCAIVGYAPEELVAQTFQQITHPEDLAADLALAEQLLRGEIPRYSLAKRYVHRSGRVVEIMLHASLVRDDDGAPRHFIAQVEDVTEKRRAERALRAQTATVALLHAVAVAANEAITSGDALLRCVGLVCAHAAWPVGHAWRVEDDGVASMGRWHLDAPERFERFCAATAGIHFARGVGLPGRALELGLPVWIEDVGADPRFLRAEAAREAGLRAGFAFPVLVGPEVVAVLEFYSDRAEEPDPALLELMASVGTQLGRVVERERHAEEVRAMSLADELTGLHNRRGFLALAGHQLKLAARLGRRAALFFLDLDGLKPINDAHGHEAGDRALAEFAAVLRETFRGSDVVARLGGDEFVALLPDCGADPETPVLARLHARLAAHNAPQARPYALAASVGVSVFDPERPETLDDLITRADAQMYRQKRARRPDPRGAPKAG